MANNSGGIVALAVLAVLALRGADRGAGGGPGGGTTIGFASASLGASVGSVSVRQVQKAAGDTVQITYEQTNTVVADGQLIPWDFTTFIGIGKPESPFFGRQFKADAQTANRQLMSAGQRTIRSVILPIRDSLGAGTKDIMVVVMADLLAPVGITVDEISGGSDSSGRWPNVPSDQQREVAARLVQDAVNVTSEPVVAQLGANLGSITVAQRRNLMTPVSEAYYSTDEFRLRQSIAQVWPWGANIRPWPQINAPVDFPLNSSAGFNQEPGLIVPSAYSIPGGAVNPFPGGPTWSRGFSPGMGQQRSLVSLYRGRG